MQFGVGQPVPRTEDPKFLMGQGQYVDDIRLPHTAVGYVLRSPYPHAKINSVDASAAKEAPGVALVLTGADAEAEGLGTIHCHVPPMAFGGPTFGFFCCFFFAMFTHHPIGLRRRRAPCSLRRGGCS